MQVKASESESGSELAAKKFAETQSSCANKCSGGEESEALGDTNKRTPKFDHDPHRVPRNNNGRPSKTYWHYKQTGIKSRPIKLLKHPIEHIERKIILTYLLGFLFKFIAIITGPFIVLAVYLLTLPIVLGRRSIWFFLNLSYTFDARIKTADVSGRKAEDGPEWRKQVEWHYCPLDYIETYWLKEKLVNNVIVAIDHRGKEFSVERLRLLVRDNILSKPNFRKFLSRIVTKGLPFYKSHYWQYMGLTQQNAHPDPTISSTQVASKSKEIAGASKSQSCVTIDTSVDQFSVTSITGENNRYNLEIPVPSMEDANEVNLEDHIFVDKVAQSTHGEVTGHVIRQYAHQLLGINLNMRRPLWELRVLPVEYGKSYLIFRCHQSLADGKCLSNILTDHLTGPSDIEVDKDLISDSKLEESCDLRPIKEKKSFISRISKSSSSKSAILVGPLTVLLWIIWTFTRRKYNHLNKRCTKHDQTSDADQVCDNRRLYMTQYSLTKFHQIKQMTRSTVSDVILCALSGAIREYLRKMSGVPNPPNLNISLAVDMRQQQDRNGSDTRQNQIRCDESDQAKTTTESENVPQVKCTLINVPLPTSIEGTVPRLWELRNTMEELRTSADPWVMLGLQYFLFIILPYSCYQWVINYIALRNSSAILSNIRGPSNMVEEWCIDLLQRAFADTQQVPTTIEVNPDSADYEILLYKGQNRSNKSKTNPKDDSGKLRLLEDIGVISAIFYCMQPPTSDIPISINCITYHDKLSITTLSRSLLIEDSKLLTRLIFKQFDQLADTIAKRRSLVTIMRAPLPIEINCEPATPLARLDTSLSDEDRNLLDEVICQSQPRLFGSHKDDIEAGVGTSDRNVRCQACKQTMCSCRRRRSLFSFDLDKHHLLNFLNPMQTKSLQTKSCEFGKDARSSENISLDSMSGQQFLMELDEETTNISERQGKDFRRGSQSPQGDNQSLRQNNTTNQMDQKRSSLSLNAQSDRKAKTESARRPKSFMCNPRGAFNSEQESIRSSSQLTVPQNVSIRGKQSKSEADLLPGAEMIETLEHGCTKKGARARIDDPISSVKKLQSKQQSSLSSRSSSGETITPTRSRNKLDLSKVGKRHISRRRKSVAIGSESTHAQRYVVIKDKMNADVSLRYQLDGPFSIGIRNRRPSTVGSASVQRRASLIPFGLMSSQGFPKLFCDDGVEL